MKLPPYQKYEDLLHRVKEQHDNNCRQSKAESSWINSFHAFDSVHRRSITNEHAFISCTCVKSRIAVLLHTKKPVGLLVETKTSLQPHPKSQLTILCHKPEIVTFHNTEVIYILKSPTEIPRGSFFRATLLIFRN